MALIKCTECGKEISDKSEICINCGCPISIIIKEISSTEKEDFPQLTTDLSIGSAVTNWRGDAVTYVKHIKTSNSHYSFNSGFLMMQRHKYGICYGNTLNIHKSQIIDMHMIDEQVEIAKDGSVATGAIIGGLLFGGLGAILGGVSEASKKGTVEVYNKIFCIDFWDTKTKSKLSLKFVGNIKQCENFIYASKESFGF